MDKVKQYVIDRLKEGSTWRGFVLCITASGVALQPNQIEAILFAGMFVSGLIGAIAPDKKESVPQ